LTHTVQPHVDYALINKHKISYRWRRIYDNKAFRTRLKRPWVAPARKMATKTTTWICM